MPKICRNARKDVHNAACIVGSEPQPNDQFQSMKHSRLEVDTCLSCRIRANESKKRWRTGQVSSSGKGVQIRPRDELKAGDEPKYGSKGHERMFKKWLKGLINEI